MVVDLIKDLPSGPLDNYRKLATFDWKKMKLFFEDLDLLQIKMNVWEALEKDPIFARTNTELTTEEQKKWAAKQLHRYFQYDFCPPEIAKLPYKARTRIMFTINEALAITFPDVSIKHGVGCGLFKNTLSTLGTERHQHILDAAWKGKIVACLALTEIAHGSNTKLMRTTATYDRRTQEFIINTPDFEAAKCWVGNLGKTCTCALLFAQLYTNGQCHGLHAFFVPIRDPKTLNTYPGIIAGDMGEKIGLHGIDNGFIMFKDYRIPREYLLNRTADVTPDGEYESSFSEPGKILGAALENLSAGRAAIITDSANILIKAVTIAVRYSALRKQFTRTLDDTKELPLLEYQLHQWRLFPYVAAAAVFRIFGTSLTGVYLEAVEKSTSSDKIGDLSDMVSEIHAIISCTKPLITWTCNDAVQQCREACGGHGFLKASRFGDLRCTIDPCVTYEGDNNVLMQQTSNWLLRQWCKLINDNEAASSPLGSCTFLDRYREILNYRFNETATIDNHFVRKCYEWLLTYLIKETYEKCQQLMDEGKSRIEARNDSQVFYARTLSLVFAEYNAINYYNDKVNKNPDNTLRTVLDQLGMLYSLSCLNKNLLYFYQGDFTQSPKFSRIIQNSILRLCTNLKNNILGVIDAMAPPDYVVNSVIGRTDGKLYENLQTTILHHPNAMVRPDWWQEILIEDPPNFHQIKSKL